jgi:hypothetical protein
MVLPFLIHIPILIFIALWLRKKTTDSPLSKFYWWALGWKTLTCIFVGVIYIYYYNSIGDTLLFQAYSSQLTDVFFANPGEFFRIFFFDEFSEAMDILNEPRVLYFVKILSLLNILTFKNYWISSLYLSLFSFMGTWMLANTIIKIFNTPLLATAFSFLFFPSFVFWTSGILKETFVIGAMNFIIAFSLQYIHLKRKLRITEVFLLIVLLYFSWKIKFYNILITLPIIVTYYLLILITKKFPVIKKTLLNSLLFLAIFSLLVLSAILVNPVLSISYLSRILYESYASIYETTMENAKIAYEFKNFGPDPLQIIQYAPEALLIGLFRPFIWEAPLNFSILTGIENFLLLILASLKIFQLIKLPKRLSIETTAVLTYVFLTATLMAMIGPNWGTLVRYKTSFFPFWLLLLSVNNPLFNFIEKHWFKMLIKPSK